MIGLGSELQVSADDRRVQIEHLSIGDEIYNHLTDSPTEIADMFVRTVKLDKESADPKQTVVYESLVGRVKLANRWNIVSRDIIATSLQNKSLPHIPAMVGDLLTYFDVFRDDYFLQYELWFSRPVLASVGGIACLFDTDERRTNPPLPGINLGLKSSNKLCRSTRR